MQHTLAWFSCLSLPRVRITGACPHDELQFLMCLKNYITFITIVVPNCRTSALPFPTPEHLHSPFLKAPQASHSCLSTLPSLQQSPVYSPLWICLFETFYINRITQYGPLVPGLFHSISKASDLGVFNSFGKHFRPHSSTIVDEIDMFLNRASILMCEVHHKGNTFMQPVFPCNNGDGRARLAVKDNLELVVEKVSEKMKPELRPRWSKGAGYVRS